MNTQTDRQVIARFDEVISTLISKGAIVSLDAYCNMYGFDVKAVSAAIDNGDISGFHFDWLSPLILDYGTSSLWLITGLGEMILPIYNPSENAA